MQSANAFRQAEDSYLRLKGQLAIGRMTREQFDAALKELMVQDAQGRYWMLGADSGKWYVYDGKSWVESNPYTSAVGAAQTPPPAASIGPEFCSQCGAHLRAGARFCSRCGQPVATALKPAIQAGAPPPAPQPTPRRKRPSCARGCLYLIATIVIVAVLIALLPTAIAFVQSLLPGLRGGDCKAVTPVVTSEVATGDTLTCSFGIADAVTIQQLAARDSALQRIATYTHAQKQLLASLAGIEGFADRSTWNDDAAIFDTRATVSGMPIFTREGVILYRDRYLIQLRLANWADETALQTRWDALLANARKLVDAKFK